MRRNRRKLSPAERHEAEAFKYSVEFQPCAVCGTPWGLPDAHHVVAAQELRRRNMPVYDPRNALPLCPIGSTHGHGCHERHENASSRIPRDVLRGCNLEFASEALGAYADDYLARRYAA